MSPHFKCLVPAARHDTGVGGRLHPVHGLDGSVVGRDLHLLVAAKVPAVHGLVRTGHVHLDSNNNNKLYWLLKHIPKEKNKYKVHLKSYVS